MEDIGKSYAADHYAIADARVNDCNLAVCCTKSTRHGFERLANQRLYTRPAAET
jgi:hypothetical protein